MSSSVVLERFLFSANQPSLVDNVKLKRQRIYILPTRHGLVYGLMLFAILLGAINYNNSMAYILTFLLGSLSLVTILHTYRNIVGLIIHGTKPEPVFAGDTAHFPLMLDNRNGHYRFAVSFVRNPKTRWWRFKVPVNEQIFTTITD